MRSHQTGFTLIELMVVIGIIAALAAAISLAVPAAIERGRRTTCTQHLSDLGKIYNVTSMDNPGAPPHSGAALLLSWRADRSHIRSGQEETLLCPGDPHMVFPRNPQDRERWDEVDLADVSDDLCSYAARDFVNHPLDRDTKEVQILACDRQGRDGATSHHKGGLIVVFDDMSTRFLDRNALGLSADAPIRVGPDAEHPLLGRVTARAD